MKNKWILLLPTILTITSCGMNEAKLKQSIKYENGTLSIDMNSSRQHHLICRYFDDVFIDTLFNDTINVDIDDRLDVGYKQYEKAYSLITKGYVPIRINLDNRVDTTFAENIELAPDNTLYAKVISGEICPIEKYYLSKTGQNDIQNWLGEDKLVTSTNMGRMLTRMNPLYYIPTSIDSFENSNIPIPILKSFAEQKYKIESNLDADNYYLYAPANISDLNNFIKDMIGNGFPLSETNLDSELSCSIRKSEGGRFVVFLIGIDNDGAYSCIPVGLVAIDNVKPVINDYSKAFEYRHKYIHNCGLTLYGVPLSSPVVQELVIISNGQFRGNDALFEVEFVSGIESISIKREIYHDYMRYGYKPETKTIKLSDKESPYYFRYVLDLFVGDNYIPMIIMDKFGNSTNYTHKITMVDGKKDAKDDD